MASCFTQTDMNITTDGEIVSYLKAKADAANIPGLSLLASSGHAGFVASLYDSALGSIVESGETADAAIAKVATRCPTGKARADKLRREAARLEAEAQELEAVA
jgi:hypothetical protein